MFNGAEIRAVFVYGLTLDTSPKIWYNIVAKSYRRVESMWWALLLGAILFLIFELPLIFFLVALPLSILLIVAFIGWLKK